MIGRVRWLALAGVVALVALAASMPAIVGGPTPAPPPSRLSWLDRLPQVSWPAFDADLRSRLLATADGEQFRASRTIDPQGHEQLCFDLGDLGGGCDPIDRTKQIQLVVRVHRRKSTTWWGIVGADARVVRARYRDGSRSEARANRAFGAVGDDSNPAVSFAALDKSGKVLGTTSADAPIASECDANGCRLYIVFSHGE